MRVGEQELINEQMDLVQLSDHEWRVSDRRKPECDGLSVIGFIERVGDAFEVTRLEEPDSRSRHSTLDRGVRYLAHCSVASSEYL